MSNAETPAEGIGGNTAASTIASSQNVAVTDLPARVRVHALAKLLGVHNKEILRALSDLGEAVRSAQSSVTRDVAIRAVETLHETAAPGAAHTESPKQEPAPVVEQTPVSPFSNQLKAAPVDTPRTSAHMPLFAAPSPIFLPPEPVARPERPARAKQDRFDRSSKPEKGEKPADAASVTNSIEEITDSTPANGGNGNGKRLDLDDENGRRRRRRGRRGRGRGKGSEEEAQPLDDSPETLAQEAMETAENTEISESDTAAPVETTATEEEDSNKRRRRRRRRKGSDDVPVDSAVEAQDDPPNTVLHVRDPKVETESKPDADMRSNRDGVRSVRGSTRLEAKRQRRRDGREAGRRRAPILSEAEFLARRESVERTMVVAEKGDTSQVAVLEDGVLVEHFVTSAGSGSIVGNVYLGRVQNVLPSMEAAFVDIGRGRNAVLYAGEVDWDAAGLEGKARKIEQALSTGDNVLVQVTKDPVGHKGARLTTQISLPGRFLVYVPAGGATGISRKLPENERRRLKDLLKHIVPEDAGVIIRTASEGITEEELSRDVRRLQAQWNVIKEKAEKAQSSAKKSSAPVMLYEEPDLLVKVVRDLFTEDFVKLEIQGAKAWETIQAYVEHVAPDLADRLHRYVGTGDVFSDHRIDEQITKALDRKVWLPSGGYLVIDRTEAMTVIDVNTGKFTGSGGNLEETVTRNNLESAEEIVRQLRLRDIGGIIVIDFIDMVLESNRDLVLRRLTECLGRDRTRHQVAEVTSLGLVQMTRKRIGTGLLEAFSAPCEHCKGRGVVVTTEVSRIAAHTQDDHTHGKSGGNQDSSGHEGHHHQAATSHGTAASEQSSSQSQSGDNRQTAHHRGEERSGSRRKNGRKLVEKPVVEAAETESTVSSPTPEQRESVVSAVQAVAHASKVAAAKHDAEQSEHVSTPNEDSTPKNGHSVDLSGSSNNDSAQSINADNTGSTTAKAEPEVAIPQPATQTVRRRPRRAASRPAGPPVGVSEEN